MTNTALGVVVPADKTGFVGYGSLDSVLDTLQGAVAQGDYLLGDHFSAVDVYLGSQIAFGLAFGSIEERPGFKAYVERVSARPAARRAAEIDDALIAAQTPAG